MDKARRLNNLKNTLEHMNCTEMMINSLEKLLILEYRIENNKSTVYSDVLDTLKKYHLQLLIQNKDYPHKRLPLFYNVKDLFIKEIEMELARITEDELIDSVK